MPYTVIKKKSPEDFIFPCDVHIYYLKFENVSCPKSILGKFQTLLMGPPEILGASSLKMFT